MKRRGFLKYIFGVLGSLTLGSFLYPLIRYLAPPTAAGRTKTLTVPKESIPEGESKDVIFNNIPIVIINRPAKGFIALSKVCTHLGCLVDYDKKTGSLICPCHGGKFGLDGKVISGPPPSPLPQFPLRVEGENIIIG